MRKPRLFPVFRSEAQARILAHVFLASDGGGKSLQEIATATDVPVSTVHREVDRLEQHGVVTSTRFARARVVRANRQSPVFDELRSLVLKTYGPPQVIAAKLVVIPGITEAYIFGSWAALEAGEPAAPIDVDVLIVGSPSALDVDTACAEASDLLGREVQPTVVSEERWRRAESGFLRTVSSRPLVQILPVQEHPA